MIDPATKWRFFSLSLHSTIMYCVVAVAYVRCRRPHSLSPSFTTSFFVVVGRCSMARSREEMKDPARKLCINICWGGGGKGELDKEGVSFGQHRISSDVTDTVKSTSTLRAMLVFFKRRRKFCSTLRIRVQRSIYVPHCSC